MSTEQAQRTFRRSFIREWRKERGMTLEQLADAADTTAAHLSNLERGLRGYSQDMIEQIATALETSVSELLAGPPSKNGSVRIDVPSDLASELIAYRDGLLKGRGKA
ncbi:helix-turn-helix domain-containing protein [Xanthobacteraceae bacterium A53D]